MDELEILIKSIQSQFNEINKKWKKMPNYFPLNMKRKRVEDIYKDESLLIYIFNYRQFINDNISEIVSNIQKNKFNNIVNTRVKASNSIQNKIQEYEVNHESGKIALKKCLNDIFGIRMIFNEDIKYEVINSFILKRFPNLKCIESSHGDYYAIHIYFGKEDNKLFQWELQLWDINHEKRNLKSHAKYKQDYTKWEQNI